MDELIRDSYTYTDELLVDFLVVPQKPNISISQCNSTSSLPYLNSFYQSQDGRYQINWSAAKVDNPDEFIVQQQINSGTWTQIAKYGAYQGSINYKNSICVTREGGNLYRYRVVAKNPKGSATSNVLGVDVEAPNSPPSATILTPINSQSYSIHDVNAFGGKIRLEATATDDNQIKSVGFYARRSGSTIENYYLATLNAGKYIHNLSGVSPGTYLVRVKAEDYDGAVFESGSRQFTIVDNYQPAITSVNFNSNTIYIGQTVSVNITASDVDDGIDKLNLIVGGTIVDTYSPENNPTTINHTFNWTPASPGEYQVGAQAIDTTGAYKSSSANIPLAVISITPPSKPNNPIACGFSEVSCQSSNELSSVDGVYLNSDTGFTLSWPAVNSDYYLLECKGCPNKQTSSFELVNSANSNEFFVASNFPQGTYEYRVSACFENPATAAGPKPDSDYCSAPSSSTFVKLFYQTPSVPVITGSGNMLSEGKFTFAWNDVLTGDDCNQVESPCYYRVEQKLGGIQSAELWQLFSLSNESITNIEILDKAVGIYSYRILACNSNGCSVSANQKVVTVAAPYINKIEVACNNSCVQFEGSFFSDGAVIRVVTDHKNNFTEYNSSIVEWVNLGAQSIARLPLTPDIALAMQRGVFNLSIINPNGSRDSASSLGDAEVLINLADASVASNNNGSVLYFANKNKLHAVSAVTGESMTGLTEGVNFASWPFITAEGEFKAAPIVDDQTDTVFIGSTNDNMYAIYPTGEEKWRYHSGGNIVSAGLLDSDKSLYFGALNGHLYSLYSENGEVEWIYKAGA